MLGTSEGLPFGALAISALAMAALVASPLTGLTGRRKKRAAPDSGGESLNAALSVPNAGSVPTATPRIHVAEGRFTFQGRKA